MKKRFRLILAAGARGDETEQNRLVRAGRRLTLSMPDHSPHAHAFGELSMLTFIELVEEAADYLEAFQRADLLGDPDTNEDDKPEAESVGSVASPEKPSKETLLPGERALDVALAAGWVLRTKAEGWKLFCERLSVPPFLLWEGFPGLDRLQRALALADTAAFTSVGFLRWLNRIRPKGEAELTEVPLSVIGVADATEEMFRTRAAWWGG
jgi:hypothetical protein